LAQATLNLVQPVDGQATNLVRRTIWPEALVKQDNRTLFCLFQKTRNPQKGRVYDKQKSHQRVAGGLYRPQGPSKGSSSLYHCCCQPCVSHSVFDLERKLDPIRCYIGSHVEQNHNTSQKAAVNRPL
jgi:hypothetical protein